MEKRGVLWIAAGIMGTVIAAVLVLLILIYTGAYNVSAKSGHSGIARWALETMMRNSVERRADAKPPQQFSRSMIEAGAGEYKAMCQQCHGGPGVTRADWAQGIVPRPPDLTRAIRRWQPDEVFWIVKNGIKMTAMPSFGETHDDQTIWNITAFVKQLPAMTPESYADFPDGHGGSEDSNEGNSH